MITGKLRVFVDADVLFAGAASPSSHGASLVVLRLAEITLIDGITAQQAVDEVERNLKQKLPEALPVFRYLLARCLTVVDTPAPAACRPFAGMADAKDLPLLVAAVEAGCTHLVTFNIRDYQPGHPQVNVMEPGRLIRQVRRHISRL
jgi:predicted nucleic acid-binding protein